MSVVSLSATERLCFSNFLRKIIFKVLKNASKKEISAAVNLLFEVDPLAVRVLNVKGKSKRSGKYLGKRGNWKKAYVTLPEGKDLDFGQS